ncbi:hypothetical protein ACIPSE_04905 [Streptomyces sp. NPDC090106]|uniref:hypothetical protein n=1 Tax=Streptomyces sp. NPDC090106 TaxID=3365946 RepID=UPI0037F95D4B
MHMRKVGMGLGAAVAVGGLLGVGALVAVKSPVGELLLRYGCGGDEEQLGELLAAEGVLEDAPDGAALDGDTYRTCDDDDLFVAVGRTYAYSGSRASALDHYRAAQGWNTVGGPGDGCFSRPVGVLAGDVTAYLTVDGPREGTLRVEIIADRGGSAWCG